MARRSYTDSERQAVREHRANLTAAAKAMEDSCPADIDRAAAILAGYSRRNVALILVQCQGRGRAFPGAVAGFHDWRKVGRKVRKGASGYFIWAPVIGKKTSDGADDSDGSPRGFTARFVFDVADTEPADVKEPAGA